MRIGQNSGGGAPARSGRGSVRLGRGPGAAEGPQGRGGFYTSREAAFPARSGARGAAAAPARGRQRSASWSSAAVGGAARRRCSRVARSFLSSFPSIPRGGSGDRPSPVTFGGRPRSPGCHGGFRPKRGLLVVGGHSPGVSQGGCCGSAGERRGLGAAAGGARAQPLPAPQPPCGWGCGSGPGPGCGTGTAGGSVREQIQSCSW